MKRLLPFFLLLIATLNLHAQDTARFERRAFRTKEGTLLYRMLPPMGYVKGQKYPLVVFLHGSGERGGDNGRQLKWGGKRFADSAQRAQFPAWVIFPQCPEGRRWYFYTSNQQVEGSPREFNFPTTDSVTLANRLVLALLDSMLGAGSVDSNRVYLGGVSMGAIGAYDLLWRRPNTFAAAIPICGAGNTATVKKYGKGFPIWVFHGSQDGSVNVHYSRQMVAELKKQGAKVKYTEYWGVGHNSWDYAFAEPDLLKWLFSQKRK
jgi:predicted peptidase